MQTVRGTIIADKGGDAPAAQPLVERLEIGALMHEAAFDRGSEK